MKREFYLALVLSGAAAFTACSSEDGPEPVVAENISETIAENPNNGQLIATLQFSPSGATLTLQNEEPVGAMEINTSGELLVLDSALFDFEARQQLTANIEVTNQGLAERVEVTVDLTDVNEVITIDSNPFAGISVGVRAAPALVDFDLDGDLDLVIGGENATGSESVLKYLENLGDGNFADMVDFEFSDSPTLLGPVPKFFDVDADGDLDLVLGKTDGTLAVFINSKGAFATADPNDFRGVDVGARSAPLGFVEISTSGEGPELLVGNSTGNIIVHKKQFGAFSGGNVQNLFETTGDGVETLSVGGEARPDYLDIDGDGDRDLIVGNSAGDMILFLNTGTENALVYDRQTGDDDPFLEVRNGVRTTPALGDLTGDGQLDLVVGFFSGKIAYYNNVDGTFKTVVGNPIVDLE